MSIDAILKDILDTFFSLFYPDFAQLPVFDDNARCTNSLVHFGPFFPMLLCRYRVSNTMCILLIESKVRKLDIMHCTRSMRMLMRHVYIKRWAKLLGYTVLSIQEVYIESYNINWVKTSWTVPD